MWLVECMREIQAVCKEISLAAASDQGTLSLGTLQTFFGEKIFYAESSYDAIENADALVILTEWTEFRRPDFDKIKTRLHPSRPVKVALMGCVVNGPGEAFECDIGIAGGKAEALLFKHGKPVRKIKYEEILNTLKEEINKL